MFTEKQVKDLAELGILPTDNPGQYVDRRCSIFVYDSEASLGGQIRLSCTFAMRDMMDILATLAQIRFILREE